MTGVEALTLVELMVNVAEVEPWATVTDAGTVAAELDGERVTVAPPDGAAALNCTVPVADWPLVTEPGEIDILARAAGRGFTVRFALTVTPEYDAEIVTGVEELTVAAVMVKVAEVEPWETVTEAGIVTAEPDFERVTLAPPDGAAALSCTVPVDD